MHSLYIVCTKVEEPKLLWNLESLTALPPEPLSSTVDVIRFEWKVQPSANRSLVI